MSIIHPNLGREALLGQAILKTQKTPSIIAVYRVGKPALTLALALAFALAFAAPWDQNRYRKPHSYIE